MSAFDDFKQNYFLLLELAYEPRRDYPLVVRKKKATGGGIYCRNGDALHKLRQVEKELAGLNASIERFFGVPDYAYLRKVAGAKKRKRRTTSRPNRKRN